MIARQ
jgi:hypothetical protein